MQGDLAEAWREGDADYASVAMRYSMVDKTLDRATGRLVEGSEQPMEVTEVWTFLRPRGGQLGALGDPANLIAPQGDNTRKALRFIPRRLFISASRNRNNVG